MRFICIILGAIFLIYSSAFGEIIFQDTYDDHNDWTITQKTSDYSNVWPLATDLPSENPTTGPRYIGWIASRTYLSGGGVGNNTLYLDSTNARGTGKGITYWCEVPDYNQPFEASDALLYITLTDTPGDYGYDEIWISVWRKFGPGFYSDKYGHKFMHASHFGGAGFNINLWFPTTSNLSNVPFIVGGLTGYGYNDSSGNKIRINYMMMAVRSSTDLWSYRPNTTGYLDCGIRNHESNSPTSYTKLLLKTTGTYQGGWQNPGNFGDGDWHYHEYHLKMNSAPGATDGIYEYFIDGVCQASYSNVPWIDTGMAMVGWNLVGLGGNEDFQDTVSGGYEVWYAWDDVVISTCRMPLPQSVQIDK